jgi:hypothetical protein
VVFHDHDGDGLFGPGDEAVQGAAVAVGGLRRTSDPHGRYTSWSALPYEPLLVRLDTAALRDPSWVAVEPEQRLRPSPHVYTRVDFPLLPTRELAGLLVAEEGVPTPAGVTVIIRRLADDGAQTALTFSDGEFYVGRLRPGEYELTVAPSSLKALGARAEPERLRVVVPAAGGEALVEAQPIRLVPTNGAPGG